MSDLLRVTVVAGRVTAEVVVPAAVPLAEVVPDLARSVGLLDAETVPRGYRIETPSGRLLLTAAGLAAQGVGDRALLAVRPGLVDDPPSRYAEILATHRARGRWPWRRRGASGRGAARAGGATTRAG